MEWIKINKKKLPDVEVIAGNFEPRTYGYKEKLLGYLSEEDGDVVCNSESEMLQGCTHYIPIHDFDIKD